MGEYIVNGEVVSVEESRPTALDIKRQSGSQPNDWVMATMPGNKVLKLEDHEALPVEAVDYSVVAPFTYGRRPVADGSYE
jgi:hypothetical protein